jgi:hypothetical protein
MSEGSDLTEVASLVLVVGVNVFAIAATGALLFYKFSPRVAWASTLATVWWILVVLGALVAVGLIAWHFSTSSGDRASRALLFSIGMALSPCLVLAALALLLKPAQA